MAADTALIILDGCTFFYSDQNGDVDALKPQAWAAAAPLLALRTLLGLDIVDGALRSRPLKSRFRKLRLRNITVRGSHADAT